MRKYLAYTGKIARETPPSRNRVVDFWRAAAICVVVIGHWLAASIYKTPEDEIELLNSLEWIPYAGWVTWIVQVMPIFFLAGGYANARGLDRVRQSGGLRRDWITARARRLFTPVIPLLLVWILLILVLRPFVASEVVFAGAMSATVPLWFLAVYLTLTALAPLTYAFWLRTGFTGVFVFAGAAIAVDIARFLFEVPGIGWTNFIFVWAAIHQLGYWWSARDEAGGIPASQGWTISAATLAVLIAVTWLGWYPVAMVGVPGAEVTNMTPPTFGIVLLGVIQAGIIWGTQPSVRRVTMKPRAWHVVVSISGVIMTLYLWHLSAMSITAAVGLFTFDGAAFRIEPGTTAWWISRPLWILILAAVTLLLVAIFARFEWRISDAPPPAARRAVVVGILLCAGSAAAVASWGITSPDAVIHWVIPVSAIAGAAILGALPQRASSDRD